MKMFFVLYRTALMSGWQTSDTEWYRFEDACAEAKHRIDSGECMHAAVMEYDNTESHSVPYSSYSYVDKIHYLPPVS